MSSNPRAEIDELEDQYNRELSLRNSAVDRLREQDSKFKKDYHALIDSNNEVRDKVIAADDEIQKLKSELARIDSSIRTKKYDLEEIAREQKFENEAKVVAACLEVFCGLI